MNVIFEKGDLKKFSKVVSANELAQFDHGMVHRVYSTFALARDAEWVGRLFVLEMKGEDEEGIGTQIHIEHKSPAFVGDEIVFTGTFDLVTQSFEIMTTFEAHCGKRLIARGMQGQKILKKERIKTLFDGIELGR
jgi:fluoroacetyl-CoA thioesterase